MKNQNILTRTLIAAALFTGATAVHAIGVDLGVDLNATTQAITDTALTGSVKAKLAADARVNASDVSVNTENGVVVLTGKVASAEAKAAAEELAKSANGTVRVVNRIEAPGLLSALSSDVKVAADATGEVITDSWISTKVKSQLLADTLTKGSAMRVTTRDNVVFLRGTVGSLAEKNQAIKLASETKGVVRVNARKLRVSTKVNASANAQ